MTNDWSNGWSIGGMGLKEGEVVAEGNGTGRCSGDISFNVLPSTTMRCSDDYPTSWIGSLSKFTYLY